MKPLFLLLVLLSQLWPARLNAQPWSLNLKVYLGGPFNGSEMNTWLNAGNKIPLNQPYNVPPWYYNGTESVSAIPLNVVDWVLVELRETCGDSSTAYKDNTIETRAGFLLKDGQVVSTDGSSLIVFDDVVICHLYAVIYHRNHLAVMSANELSLNASQYSYDFSTGSGQAYGGSTAHKEIAPGTWGMVPADGNSDGQVNNADKNEVWKPQAGQSGYLAGDFNLDGYVNNPDKILFWVPGSGYSSQVVPAFACGMPAVDVDGNTYNTVLIGTQCWMKENLNVGTMVNGSQSQTNNGIIEKYCYDNYTANCNTYGGLYQWNEMMQYVTTPGTQGICPKDWHLPTDFKWCILEEYVDAAISCYIYGWRGVDGGGKLKEAGTSHWNSPNSGAINSSGFTALPGGSLNTNGSFVNLGYCGYFWSSSEYGSSARGRHLQYDNAQVNRYILNKDSPNSVRCLWAGGIAPVANFSGNPTSGTAPLTVSFTDLSSNTPIIWQWNFGDGGTSTLQNPSHTYNTAGNYTVQLTATNSYGPDTEIKTNYISVGDTIEPCPGTPTVTYFGQVYNTVLIGTQCWLKENLNVGWMIDGSQNQINNGQMEKYCYNNNIANCATYGGLYQWDEMMGYTTTPGVQGICPPGWHIPTDEEWKELEGAVDSQYGYPDPEWNEAGWRGFDAGLHLKSTTGWNSGGNGTNLFGFGALPGGYRYSDGSFGNLGNYGHWWTSSDYSGASAWRRYLSYVEDRSYRFNNYDETGGRSVRCLQD